MGIEALLTSQVIGLDAALSGKLSTSGGTVTGQLTNALGTITASTPLTISQTWDNAAVTFKSLLVSVTDTQSASGSLLMDLQVGGTSKFKVTKAGGLTADAVVTTRGITANDRSTFSSIISIGNGGSNPDTNNSVYAINVFGAYGITFSPSGSAWDLAIFRDSGNILAQRNSTNAQTFRLYNTYTSSTSFENLQLQWSSNEARIGTSVGSAGGTQRNLVLGTWDSAGTWAGTVTIGSSGSVKVIRTAVSGGYNAFNETLRAENLDNASLNIVSATNRSSHIYFSDTAYAGHIQYYHVDDSFNFFNAGQKRIVFDSSGCIQQTPTWNSAGTTFTGILANVTDTASASGSLLMDLQVGGNSIFNVRRAYITGSKYDRAVVSIPQYSYFSSRLTGGFVGFGVDESTVNFAIDIGSTSGVRLISGGYLAWNNSASNVPAGTNDLLLYRDAARTLALRDGVNANVFNIYNTYTSSTSYERGKIAWESNVLKIGTEKGSAGGSARALELQTDGTTRLTITTAGTVDCGAGVIQTTNHIQCGIAAEFRWGNTTSKMKCPSNGVITFLNALENDFGRLQFGGTTASYPAIKRNAAAINFRLADDSGDADITAKAATFSGNVTVSAVNLVTDTTTGTKIGTGTTQKLGFWNATPVVQPTAVADATDAASVITQLNALLSRMRDLGLIAT